MPGRTTSRRDPLGIMRSMAAQLWLAGRRPEQPPHRFVVFGRGRSGTTLLVELMSSHPKVHCDGEVFAVPRRRPHATVRARAAWARSRHGAEAYGFKLLSQQVKEVLAPPRSGSFLQALHHDGYRVIYLRRRDLLRHALSNIRARRFAFHLRSGQEADRARFEVDPDELLHWLRASRELADLESGLVAGLPHLSLVYEDDLADPSRHQQTADLVCEHVGIPAAPVTSDLVKTAPGRLEDLVTNVAVVQEALAGTEFEQFL